MSVQFYPQKAPAQFTQSQLAEVSSACKSAITEYFGPIVVNNLEQKHGSSAFDPERICKLSPPDQEVSELLRESAEKGDASAQDILKNELAPVFFALFPDKLIKKLSPLINENPAANYYCTLLLDQGQLFVDEEDDEEGSDDFDENPFPSLSTPFQFEAPSSVNSGPLTTSASTDFVFGNDNNAAPSASPNPSFNLSPSWIPDDPMSDQ